MDACGYKWKTKMIRIGWFPCRSWSENAVGEHNKEFNEQKRKFSGCKGRDLSTKFNA